ncbi:MAG TPA: transcriptional regulator [Caulobacteraceae bacterium]|nr:transcriptional regulator [Caulobacteraceae bacterium]
MTTVDNSYLLTLFGNTSSTSTNLFAALYPQSTSAASTSTPAVTTSINTPSPPTPPWASGSTAAQQAALVTTALARQPIINANAISLTSTTPQNDDYRNLFAIYQGLNALDGLAADASKANLSPTQQTQYANAFQTGLTQVMSYVGSTKFDNLTLAVGSTSSSQTSTAGVSTAANSDQYVGQPMYLGDSSQPVPAFAGDVEFSLTAKQLNGPTIQVDFNLAEMGSTPRTLANVLGYLNGKLADNGVATRFSDKQMLAPPNTITVNGKTVTLPDAPTQYALTLNTSALETVSLSAPQTADAVYVTQSATATTTGAAAKAVMGTSTSTTDNVTTTTTGSTTTTTTVDQQLLKFQTDNSSTATPPPDTTVRPGDTNSVAGRSWSETLASATTSALATATGPDGSVYVLSNVDDAVGGQNIAGQSDVALMKYDSTGKLIYTRTLGASTSASGLALAVSSTGQVAIAGSVTGDLTGTDVGELQSTVNGVNQTATNASGTPDSFVTLLDASGNELWTQSAGGVQANQANAVAFSADGSQVYVAGKTQSPMQGGGQEQGGWDGYLQGFSATTGKRAFTQQFGTTGSDSATSIAVNGNSVLVGSVDNGDAVVRNFDVTDPTAVSLTASQDLGNLQGGNVVGIGISNGQLVVAGTANNTALGSGVATAVNAAPAGSNVFVASLDPTLSSTSGNTIAWYGGSGNDAATAMTVANGQVYVAGKTSADLPGTTAIGKQDGFVAEIDPTTGAATWSERFSGPGGNVSPQSIAVASNGASVLDRLGLPSGTLQMGDPSNLVTSATSLRAGDKFTVAANGGPPVTVTIEADDTMQTLAKKIARASGSNATVQVLSNGSVAQLNIKPFLQNSSITLGQGPAGEDALGPLGLKAGVIQNTPASSSSSSSTSKPLSGLGLSTTLNLSSPDSIAVAKSALDQALSTIKIAYLKLISIGQPPANPAASSASGTVPTYLSNEISNYQAALLRLTGQT